MEASHNKNAGMDALTVKLTHYMKCVMKTHIEDNNPERQSQVALSVHDQQVSECEKITLHSGQSHKQS
jgi:hypothetical protein